LLRAIGLTLRLLGSLLIFCLLAQQSHPPNLHAVGMRER
jgi:hypothetical protein